MTRTPRHPGIDLSLPDTWTIERGHPPLVLRARSRMIAPSGFTPRLTVTARPAALDGDGPASRTVPDAEVEDSDEYEIAGRPVSYLLLGHHQGGRALLSEQWTWQADGTDVMLTGTMAREDYLECCEVFERIASTVVITPHAVA